ncbi:hypothetical protein LCL89_13150 [Halobacillus yeomjeoni]|uniref:glutaredoxin family protein n=1 Tax=Halobacillus yeomjeoni TaxID=311194 RepID=UPI001CD21BC6|nr:glutaredoxin domain-containing protein [Halobacillus yeomjeoni]MCA0984984.1 hypothetical protein [Halobacillus yeomjeoni]
MNTLYTIHGCSVCARSRKHLIQEEIPFEEVNILNTPMAQRNLKEHIGEVYTPVLVTNESVVKGKDILTYQG